MAKVLLTEAQRREARYEQLRVRIGEGLNNFKLRSRVTGKGALTNKELGKNLGMGNGTIGKIIAGEDVRISVDKFFRVLELAGMEIRVKREEDRL